MKRFLEISMAIKAQACIIFTGTMLAYALIYGFLVEWQVTVAMIFELALVSLLCAVIQFVFFSGVVIRTMSYGKRILCALPIFLAVMLGAALVFHWFPAEEWTGWLVFLVIFALAFGGITLGFEIYFRLSGRKYDGMLAEYKRRHAEE